MMSIDPLDLLALVILVTVSALAIKGLFASTKHLEPEDEEDEMPERDLDYVVENADDNDVLKAKMQCLELGIGMHNDNPDKAIETAKKFWDFISLEPQGDE